MKYYILRENKELHPDNHKLLEYLVGTPSSIEFKSRTELNRMAPGIHLSAQEHIGVPLFDKNEKGELHPSLVQIEIDQDQILDYIKSNEIEDVIVFKENPEEVERVSLETIIDELSPKPVAEITVDIREIKLRSMSPELLKEEIIKELKSR